MFISIWGNIASRLRKIKKSGKKYRFLFWNLCQFNICFSETREWSKADWLLSQFVFCEFTEYHHKIDSKLVYKICETCNAWKIQKWNSLHVKWSNAPHSHRLSNLLKKALENMKEKKCFQKFNKTSRDKSVGMGFRFVPISS